MLLVGPAKRPAWGAAGLVAAGGQRTRCDRRCLLARARFSPPCPQARRLDIRLRTPKGPGGENKKEYVHMLNGTLSGEGSGCTCSTARCRVGAPGGLPALGLLGGKNVRACRGQQQAPAHPPRTAGTPRFPGCPTSLICGHCVHAVQRAGLLAAQHRQHATGALHPRPRPTRIPSPCPHPHPPVPRSHVAHAVLPAGELPDPRGRARPRVPAALHDGHRLHPLQARQGGWPRQRAGDLSPAADSAVKSAQQPPLTPARCCLLNNPCATRSLMHLQASARPPSPLQEAV